MKGKLSRTVAYNVELSIKYFQVVMQCLQDAEASVIVSCNWRGLSCIVSLTQSQPSSAAFKLRIIAWSLHFIPTHHSTIHTCFQETSIFTLVMIAEEVLKGNCCGMTGGCILNVIIHWCSDCFNVPQALMFKIQTRSCVSWSPKYLNILLHFVCKPVCNKYCKKCEQHSLDCACWHSTAFRALY